MKNCLIDWVSHPTGPTLNRLAEAANARNVATVRALLKLANTPRGSHRVLRYPKLVTHRRQEAAPQFDPPAPG